MPDFENSYTFRTWDPRKLRVADTYTKALLTFNSPESLVAAFMHLAQFLSDEEYRDMQANIPSFVYADMLKQHVEAFDLHERPPVPFARFRFFRVWVPEELRSLYGREYYEALEREALEGLIEVPK